LRPMRLAQGNRKPWMGVFIAISLANRFKKGGRQCRSNNESTI
jgi:hypothetical protein